MVVSGTSGVFVVASCSFWVLKIVSGVLAKIALISCVPEGGLCKISYAVALPRLRFLNASVLAPPVVLSVNVLATWLLGRLVGAWYKKVVT
jgi:hypothetical protein